MALEEKQDVPLGDALAIRAYGKICLGDLQSALQIVDQSISYLKPTTAYGSLSKAYSYKVTALSMTSQMDSALYYSSLQTDAAFLALDTILISASYLSRCNIYSALSQQDSIVYYAIKGLESMGNFKHDGVRGGLNMSIGNAYYQNEDYPQAVKYYSEASKFYDDGNPNLGGITHNLATSFTQLKMYDSSFHYLDKSISINKKFGRDLQLAFNYQALAMNYSASGDCRNAIETSLVALGYSDRVGEIRSKAAVFANVSECYVKLGQFEKAIQSAQEAVKLTKENGDVDKEADAHFLLSRAYEANGQFRKAYESHKNFYSLDSLLLNRDKQETIASLETKYGTAKKEAEIRSLSQQSSIQSLEIQQKNLTITVGSIVFLLIVLSLYFVYQQRTIKRSREQTELEQRFLRSQLNPHFISNALLAVQNFMLKNDAESAALYLTKFSKLMREILENSRKEFIPVEEEVNMLTNYLEIHRLRFNDAFEYNIKLDEKIDPETDTIPPMFVQPFVENSIEHGIINANGKGKIDLNFVKEESYIAIEVEDNGGGFAKKGHDAEHQSLSSTIIKERMELFNRTLKNKIRLVLKEITNDEGQVEGTKAELKVPFSYI